MVLTTKESLYQYTNLLIRLDCVGHDALACLQSKTVAEIQEKNSNDPFPGAAHPPIFMWGPVIDGDLIRQLPYEAFRENNSIKVPVIFGDDINGGTIFAPSKT